MNPRTPSAAGVSVGQRETRRLFTALTFIGPNLAGFLMFTALPLLLSFGMAFTNYNLQRNNQLRAQQLDLGAVPVQFVGAENFTHLAQEPRLLDYFGNTLFLMLGIPFNIAGSLFLAVMLSRDLHVGAPRRQLGTRRGLPLRPMLGAAALMALGVTFLLISGAGAAAMVVLVGGLIAAIFLGGLSGGSTVYRTLFYLPNFTAGVAVYMLWKRLYAVKGPLYYGLLDPLRGLTEVLRTQAWARGAFGLGAVVLLAALLASTLWGLSMLRRRRVDAELGRGSLVVALAAVLGPALAWGYQALPAALPGWAVVAVLVAGFAGVATVLSSQPPFRPTRLWEGFGGTLFHSALVGVVGLILLGLAVACQALPVAAQSPEGLVPPDFLNNFAFAKPALMVMGFWAAVGSNNMLLYLAGISNVPPELYEAADIDGAGRAQKFWNVTWPQLAPTTFFIVIMSVIGGLQGGFDAARVMTQGQAGTTTLTYFIFNKVYQEAALNQAAAIAWVLFALVFVVTLFNWKVGNQYVND